MAKITEFKCKDCGEIFDRSDAVKKLDEVESNITGKPVMTEVLGCPECSSRNLSSESMGELDAEE